MTVTEGVYYCNDIGENIVWGGIGKKEGEVQGAIPMPIKSVYGKRK